MPRKTPKPGKWRFAGGILIVCLVAAVVVTLVPLRQSLLVRYWELELSRAADDRVGDILRIMVKLDEPGINALARALGSSRTSVAQSAYEALSDELNTWSRLEPIEANDRLTVLAAALAAHADKKHSAARGAAARLAVRVLLWPCDRVPAERVRLVADCEHVLHAAGAPTRRAMKAVSPAPRVAVRTAPQSSPRMPAAPRRVDAEKLANRPAASITLTDFAPPALARAVTDDLANTRAGEPGRFDDTNTAALASADSASTAVADGRADVGEESSPTDVLGISPAKHESSEDARRLKSLDIFVLCGRLHDTDDVATEAAAELRARGLTIRQIEVGMHLTSLDAHERRLWTEALPGIRGVSAKAWLLHLSRDENVGVRRAAVGLLATSGDPEMLRRVAEVARQDSDHELRLEAARAAELIEQPSAYTASGQQ